MKKFFGVIAVCIIVLSSVMFYQNANAAEKKLAKWTFIVFLNSDNDLNAYADWVIGDIGEMARIGSTEDVNIVVLHDKKAAPAQRLFIKKGKVEVIENVGEIDMGDYRELIKFACWACEKYPAEKYLLDVWNHGDGWEKTDRITNKGISYDYDSGNYINTPNLGEAIKQIKAYIGRNIDVFGMDACQMQVMEVAYELKDNVNYIVASQEAEPADGWPYDKILKPLVENPLMSPRDLALTIVGAYDEEYRNNDTPVTQSAIDCSKLDGVFNAIDKFSQTLLNKIDENDFMKLVSYNIIPELQFYDPNTFDLVHLCQLLTKYFKNDAVIVEACENVINAVCAGPDKAVMANIHYTEYEKNSNGLSIYFPQEINVVPQAYGLLLFNNNCWSSFIRAYIERVNE